MQPHDLTKFSKNNDLPSEAVFMEVKDLLLKPLRELEKNKEEIERLIKTLEGLEEEREIIQESVAEYNTILSPIRRISSDILHEIFYHCLPTHRNPIMSITEAPLVLTRICRPWRSVALSSHRIWSKLHIPLLPCSLNSPCIDMAAREMAELQQRRLEIEEKYAKTMQARSELAQIWLSRSGSCPLSISISFVSGFQQDNLDESNSFLQLFSTIIFFSERFHDLELSMPFEIYQVLQKMISLGMVPNLRNLRANFFDRVLPYPNMPSSPITLLQAPNLLSLSLFTYNTRDETLDSMSIPSTWKNLTRLFLHYPITTAEAVQVLQRCQNLDHCKLAISGGQDAFIGLEDSIFLPRLRFLCIQVCGLDLMAFLYRGIDALGLNSFEYQTYPGYPGHNFHAPHSAPLLSLLEKSASIEKLSLDPGMLAVQDILFAFRITSKVTHLTLGQRPSDRQSVILAKEYGYLEVAFDKGGMKNAKALVCFVYVTSGYSG